MSTLPSRRCIRTTRPGFCDRTPCGYHDIAVIRADLAQSGFGDANIETLDLASRAASADDAAIGFVRGTPLSGEISVRDPRDPGAIPRARSLGLDRAVEAASKAIAARFGRGPIQARMQAHVVTTQRRAL